MSSRSTNSKVSDASAQLACSRNPSTWTGTPARAISSSGRRNAWPSADATTSPARPSAAPLIDVVQHVAVDIAVFVDLGFGEDSKPDVAQRVHPGPHHFGAAWGDVGENGGLGLELRGAGRPASWLRPQRCGPVATGPARRSGVVPARWPPAQDRTQAHVEVRRVPYQQKTLSRLVRCRAGIAGESPARWRQVRLCAFPRSGSWLSISGRCSQQQFGDGAAGLLRLGLVFGGGPDDGDRQSAARSAGSTRTSRGSASPTSAICSA